MQDVFEKLKKRASNPKHYCDMASGSPSTLAPATERQVKAAEKRLGFSLPVFLRRLYLEIGNGGFGPGYGLIPVAKGGKGDVFGKTIVEVHKAFTNPENELIIPDNMLPVLTWGCGIYTIIDCSDPNGATGFCEIGEHVLDGKNTSVKIYNAKGKLVSEILPEAGESVTKKGPAAYARLVLHKNSAEEYFGAWAKGTDLWKEMNA